MSAPTIDEQIAALEHLIPLLHRLYDRQVGEHRMTHTQAAERLAAIGAALTTLQTVKRLEEMW